MTVDGVAAKVRRRCFGRRAAMLPTAGAVAAKVRRRCYRRRARLLPRYAGVATFGDASGGAAEGAPAGRDRGWGFVVVMLWSSREEGKGASRRTNGAFFFFSTGTRVRWTRGTLSATPKIPSDNKDTLWSSHQKKKKRHPVVQRVHSHVCYKEFFFPLPLFF